VIGAKQENKIGLFLQNVVNSMQDE